MAADAWAARREIDGMATIPLHAEILLKGITGKDIAQKEITQIDAKIQ